MHSIVPTSTFFFPTDKWGNAVHMSPLPATLVHY
jgi:hypothetical protein